MAVNESGIAKLIHDPATTFTNGEREAFNKIIGDPL